ncbi:MAG: single-stranded-DNA-specific exonuclease RecJ [Candidatus Campbellbacteria bacterium]|nr:single-stranded-DNA-specific exonuclease RecJ [Candidatus Campbellbacteria bacterium]
MKEYTIAEKPSGERARELAEYSEIVQNLLFHRGIVTAPAAEAFISPDYDRDVHDPFLLHNMDKAIERILLAIERNEHIALFSDFDADGIPSAVVMHDVLKKIGYENFSITIPHRNIEGFGLNETAISNFIEKKVGLIITLDCGMGDVGHIARATEAGIDVIITDHHMENQEVPKAFAIVNPNQEGDTYPNKNLCGAGVAFKVAQAFLQKLEDKSKKKELTPAFMLHPSIAPGWEKWLLDMVGIATLSDMVSLTGENRVFVHYGLLVLRKSPRLGVRTLLSHLRIKQHTLTEDDVVFMITPRINAASRMDEPEAAFQLLSTTDLTEAETLVRHLDTINNERKGAVAQMSKEIKQKFEETPNEFPVIVVGNTHWRPGLLGLAATHAVEAYGKSAFVWGRGDAAVIKGSVRSDGRVGVMELMSEVRHLFIEFGGHKYSGGFSITVENLMLLEGALSEAHTKLASKEVSEEKLTVDAVLSLDDVTQTTYSDITQLAPFGAGNPKPVFAFEQIQIDRVEMFGKEKQHIKLLFKTSANKMISAVKFFAKGNPTLEGLSAGQSITLLASLEKETFGYTNGIRLRIVDVLTS